MNRSLNPVKVVPVLCLLLGPRGRHLMSARVSIIAEVFVTEEEGH
jgi:hypothetical protein